MVMLLSVFNFKVSLIQALWYCGTGALENTGVIDSVA